MLHKNDFIYLIILFLLVPAGTLHAQTDWRDGWIIDRNGAKRKVQIAYKNWDKSPDAIKIREKGAVTNVGLQEIQEFYVSNEYYLAFRGKVVDLPKMDTDLLYDSQTRYREEAIFLRYLRRDSLSLLLYKDHRAKEHFFIQRGTEKPMELEFYKYKSEIQEPTITLRNERYKLQLSYLFNDCGKKSSIVDNLKYRQKEMIEAFDSYYKCVRVRPDYSWIKESNPPKLGIFLGGVHGNYRFKSSVQPAIESANYEKKVGTQMGLAVSFIVPRTAKKFHIDSDLAFLFVKQEGYYESPSTFRDELSYVIDATYVRLSMGASRSLYFDGQYSLSVGAGLVNLFVKPSFTQTQKRYDTDNELTLNQTKEVLAEDELKTEQALYLRLKAQRDQWALIGWTEFGNGFSSILTLGVTTTRVGVGVAYYFQ